MEYLDELEDIDLAACRRLFSAVLLQAIKDAHNDLPAQRPFRDAARAWFGTPEFSWCCLMAGVDHHAALRALQGVARRTKASDPFYPTPCDPRTAKELKLPVNMALRVEDGVDHPGDADECMAEAIKLWQGGQSMKKAACAVGLSEYALRRQLVRAGFITDRGRPPRFSSEGYKAVMQFFDPSLSVRELHARLANAGYKMTENALRHRLLRLGLKPGAAIRGRRPPGRNKGDTSDE